MNTEYQVEITIKETRGGNPLKEGRRFYKTVWVQATYADFPVDVIHAAKNLMNTATHWRHHK